MKNCYIANTALGIGKEGLMAQLAIADKNAEQPYLLGPFSVNEEAIEYLILISGAPTWEGMINSPIQAEITDGKVTKIAHFLDEDKYMDFGVEDVPVTEDTEDDGLEIAINEVTE